MLYHHGQAAHNVVRPDRSVSDSMMPSPTSCLPQESEKARLNAIRRQARRASNADGVRAGESRAPHPTQRLPHQSAMPAAFKATAAATAQQACRISSAEGLASRAGFIMPRITSASSEPQSAGGPTEPERSSIHRSPDPGSSSPERSSYTTMPKEKMSAAVDGLLSRRSRDKYRASPSCSFHALRAAAWPRSPILKTPSELIRILSGLMSQCITACEWMWASPRAICLIISQIRGSADAHESANPSRCMSCPSVPPVQSSICT
mmetsp:Transcript_11079/g.34223  ORF Transcript_11079/g.34223 Transcript_11079/m.34223 type:complete len:263 (-) Transcript_11079:1260-2048(-)